jgi:hypothetical protein
MPEESGAGKKSAVRTGGAPCLVSGQRKIKEFKDLKIFFKTRPSEPKDSLSGW